MSTVSHECSGLRECLYHPRWHVWWDPYREGLPWAVWTPTGLCRHSFHTFAEAIEYAQRMAREEAQR